jgi:hypothetical protein
MAKVGRNDPCPCGSGLKFEKCCAALGQAPAWRGADPSPASRTATLVMLVKDFARAAKPTAYEFLEHEAFGTLLEAGDRRQTNQIYVREILYRAHFGASTGLLRLSSWLGGIEFGKQSRNPLVLASSLRGLIESAADNYHTFGTVPDMLAGYHLAIAGALDGTLDKIFLAPELEEGLIHFISGRQLSREEKAYAPPSHQALHASQYLQDLAPDIPDIAAVYADLCQITHPASDSLYCFGVRHSRTVTSLEPGVPEAVMAGLDRSTDRLLYPLLANGALPCLATLKVINRFERAGLSTPFANAISATDIPHWPTIERRLSSRELPPEPPPSEIEEIIDEYQKDRPDILGRMRRKRKSAPSS